MMNLITGLSMPRSKMGVWTILAVVLAAITAWALYSSGPAVNAQENRDIGRGFTAVVTGVVTGEAGDTVTVEAKGHTFELLVTGDTRIDAPPDRDVPISRLTDSPGARIAVLADQPVRQGGVAADGPVTAQRITVVPGKATRQHKRVITTAKTNGGLQALDSDGTERDIAGGLSGEVERGEGLVLIVQLGNRPGAVEKIRAFLKANDIDARLERLSVGGDADPLRKARLEELKERRDSAEEQRLQRISDKAESRVKNIVQEAVKRLQDKRAAGGGRAGGVGAISQCARELLGRNPGRFGELSPDEQERLTEKCLRGDRDRDLKVKMEFPENGDSVQPGSTIILEAEAEADGDDVKIESVTFVVGSVRLPGAAEDDSHYTAVYTVPSDAASLIISAVAVGTNGREATHEIRVRVSSDDPPPKVKITAPAVSSDDGSSDDGSSDDGDSEDEDTSRVSPPRGIIIVEGDTVAVSAEATDNGSIASVVFIIDGEEQAPLTAAPYSMRYTVPVTPSAEAPVPITIVAVATDNLGQTARARVLVDVRRADTGAPTVRITEPPADAKIRPGDTVVFEAEIDGDNAVESVTFTVNGERGQPVRVRPFTYRYVVPGATGRNSNGSSSVPPHVFVGAVTRGGEPAADGAVVEVYVEGFSTSTLKVEAVALSASGQKGSASVSLQVLAERIYAGETAVTDGRYTVNAGQPSGQSFSGGKVTFTVDGCDASQTGTWIQGGADILDLSLADPKCKS